MQKQSGTRAKGFTLIELLIVIAIIGILAGIVIPTYQSSIRKANEAAAVVTLNTIKVAEAKYVIDHKGQYGGQSIAIAPSKKHRGFDRWYWVGTSGKAPNRIFPLR